MLPPLLAHPELVFGKVGLGGLPSADAWLRAIRFWFTPSSGVAIACGLAFAFGAWRLAVTAPRLAACAAASSLALACGIAASAPAYAWLGFVLARYALPALPFVCLALALACQHGRLAGAPGAFVALGLGVALLLASGLPNAWARTPAWLPGRWIPAVEGTPPTPREVPAFYRQLAESKERVVLAETPWIYGLWNNVLPDYAALHGQDVRIGFGTGLCTPLTWGQLPADAGLHLRGFVHLADEAALDAAGIDFVVLHRDPLSELAQVIDPIDAKATPIPDVTGCGDALRARGWQHAFEDERVLVLSAPTG